MNIDTGNYDVAWKFMPENWSLNFTDHAGRCNLPLFVADDDWVNYKKTGEFSVGATSVCIGILYTWSEPDKWLFGDNGKLDDYRQRIFANYATQLTFNDSSEMLTSLSAWVRDNCGIVPSQRVLEGAINIEPQNSLVRYDYMIDTWLLIETIPTIDLTGACRSILSISTTLDFDSLFTASGEKGQQNINSVCYMCLASLLLIGDKVEFTRAYELMAGKIMQAPTLQSKLHSLAHKESVDIDDLRIMTSR